MITILTLHMIQQYFVDKLRFIFFKIFTIENLKFLVFWKFSESNNLLGFYFFENFKELVDFMK